MANEWGDWSIDSYDLSSPFTAVDSVREGAFLLRRGMSPYDSPICRHPFLLLQLLDAADRSGALVPLLLGAHVLTAWALSRLARAIQPHDRCTPRIIGAVYLLSPWNVAACITRSSAGVSHLLTAVGLLMAHAGATAGAATAVALAAYTAPDAAWLLPATALLCASRARVRGGVLGGRGVAHVARFVGWCAACLAGLLLASRAGLGSWSFLRVYAAWLTAEDNQPNCGAWWYLLVQVFPPQRPVMVAAIHLLPRLFLPLLALKLRRRPLLAACLSAAYGHSCQAYPTAGCLCFSLALAAACCDAELRRRTAHAPPAAVLLLATLSCLPSLRIGWLERRMLNANFPYAATLLLNAAHAGLLLDVTAAALGRDALAAAHAAAARVQRAWRRRQAQQQARTRRGARQGLRGAPEGADATGRGSARGGSRQRASPSRKVTAAHAAHAIND